MDGDYDRRERKRDRRGRKKGGRRDSREHGEMKQEDEKGNENNDWSDKVLSSKDIRKSRKEENDEGKNESK